MTHAQAIKIARLVDELRAFLATLYDGATADESLALDMIDARLRESFAAAARLAGRAA